LVEHFHGKEGVIGSSPIESFSRTPCKERKTPQVDSAKSPEKSGLRAKCGQQPAASTGAGARSRGRIADPFPAPEHENARALLSEPPRSVGGQTKENDVEPGLPADDPPLLDWPSALMTATEVAAVLRITPKTVREHIRRGKLRALRIDGTGPYRVRDVDAQAWPRRSWSSPTSARSPSTAT
jgi:excisionase family DNA binding protein